MATNNRFLVIVNPVSGGGRSARLAAELKQGPAGLQALASKQEAGEPRDWPVIETTKDESWRVAAETQIRTGRIHSVVVIGGDGTIMETATLLYELKRSGLAVVPNLVPLPGGRGNDFIRGLYGYSTEAGEIWAWLAARREWRAKFLDLASCNGRVFMNMASVGYGGEVVEKIETRKTLWSKSSLVYQIEGALGMVSGSSGRCEAKADGEVKYSGAFFGAFVGNGRANGSGLYWTNAAELDDGMLDAIVFPKPGILAMAASIGAVKKRKAPPFRHAVLKGAELVFHFDQPAAVELDGEFAGKSLTHEFKSIKHALRVWLPS